jgi:hypothetical protein
LQLSGLALAVLAVLGADDTNPAKLQAANGLFLLDAIAPYTSDELHYAKPKLRDALHIRWSNPKAREYVPRALDDGEG